MFSLEIVCHHPTTMTSNQSPANTKEWKMGFHSFACPEGKHVEGKKFEI